MRMFAVMLVLLGCGGVDGAPRCEPGRAQSCPCAGGGQGSQECGLGGAWSVCTCLSADAGADVSVADSAADALDVFQDAGPEIATNDAAGTDDVLQADAASQDAQRDSAPEAMTCPRGFADCNDMPGCETDITTVLNCGGCSRACPTGGGYHCCPNAEVNRCPRVDQACQ